MTLLRIGMLAGVVWVLFGVVWMPVRVRGTSMEPTFRDGSVRLGRRRAYRRRPPQPGDVVIIRSRGGRTFYLKRVLALAGQEVGFEHGVLHVGGEPVPEPYLRELGDWTMPAQRVPENSLFVAGDHRAVPLAEHVAGFVPAHLIMGGMTR